MSEYKSSIPASENGMNIALQGRILQSPDSYNNIVTGGINTIEGYISRIEKLRKEINETKGKRYNTFAGIIVSGIGSAASCYFFLPEPYNLIGLVASIVVAFAACFLYGFSPSGRHSVENKKKMLDGLEDLLNKNLGILTKTADAEFAHNQYSTEQNYDLQKRVIEKNMQLGQMKNAQEIMLGKENFVKDHKHFENEVAGFQEIQNLNDINRAINKQFV